MTQTRSHWSCFVNPGANPTIVSYNASAVKICNATSSQERLQSKTIFFWILLNPALSYRNAVVVVVNYKSRRTGSRLSLNEPTCVFWRTVFVKLDFVATVQQSRAKLSLLVGHWCSGIETVYGPRIFEICSDTGLPDFTRYNIPKRGKFNLITTKYTIKLTKWL
jgi:hypothetical protein